MAKFLKLLKRNSHQRTSDIWSLDGNKSTKSLNFQSVYFCFIMTATNSAVVDSLWLPFLLKPALWHFWLGFSLPCCCCWLLSAVWELGKQWWQSGDCPSETSPEMFKKHTQEEYSKTNNRRSAAGEENKLQIIIYNIVMCRDSWSLERKQTVTDALRAHLRWKHWYLIRIHTHKQCKFMSMRFSMGPLVSITGKALQCQSPQILE